MLYSFARFIINIYISIYYRFKVVGQENIPLNQGFIICANHIHWGDPIMIACKATKRHIHFLGKIELFKNRIFSFVLRNINVIPLRRGENDVNAIKNALRVLKNNEVLGIFPEGTRVREGEDKKPESGTVMLAIKSKVPILPIGIESNYGFRDTVNIYIGEPIILSQYFGKKVNKEELENISFKIMQDIKSLIE